MDPGVSPNSALVASCLSIVNLSTINFLFSAAAERRFAINSMQRAEIDTHRRSVAFG